MENYTDTSLEDYLFEEKKGLFTSPASLAARLSELPGTSYVKSKSVEALVSQIIRRKKPIPDRLVEEIIRLVRTDSDFYDISEINEIDSKLPILARQHNLEVRAARKALASQSLTSSWEAALSINAAEQVWVLNESTFEQSYNLLLIIIQAQAAALRLINVEHSDCILKGFDDFDAGDRIWNADKKRVDFTFFVPNRTCAHTIWGCYFRYACAQETKKAGVNESPPDYFKFNPYILRKITEKINIESIKNSVRICILPEPLNAICSTSSFAVSPGIADKMEVFVLASKTVTPVSDSEAFTWRNLIYGNRFHLLSVGRLIHWSDVKDSVVAEHSIV